MTTPTVLYHYTDPPGLSGMVASRELWATDVRFLNDEDELKYAWREFLDIWNARQSEPSEFSEAYRAVLDAIGSANATDLDSIEDRIFSTSFSDDGDDLNQWVLYGAKGKGFALGFDVENIRVLQVPYFYHTQGGELVPVPTTISGTDTQVPFVWGAFLQPVRYGDAEREKAIGEVFWQIEQICGTNDVGTAAQKVVNAIFRIPEYLSMLALVKNDGFKAEHEWRITTPEHFGSFSASRMSALALVEGFRTFGQGPLMTVDVQFRDGGSRGFKPYTKIPFDHSALVEVVLGPAIDPERGTLSTRRLLDRHGFRHTKIVPSKLTYRPD